MAKFELEVAPCPARARGHLNQLRLWGSNSVITLKHLIALLIQRSIQEEPSLGFISFRLTYLETRSPPLASIVSWVRVETKTSCLLQDPRVKRAKRVSPFFRVGHLCIHCVVVVFFAITSEV